MLTAGPHAPSPPTSPKRRRTLLPANGDRPHELDFSQLSGLSPLSDSTYAASWLHTPVLVQVCTTPAEASAARAMTGLRHPNLEFLLGQTRSPAAAVTERAVSARSLEDVLSAGALPLPDALRFATDVGRGLLYLHVKTGQAHGRVAAPAVTVDFARRRAVLRMLCRPVAGGDRGFGGDVKALVQLLLGMMGDKDEALRMLALENPNSYADVADLIEVVEIVRRPQPEERVLAMSMNSLVAVLCKVLRLVSPA